MAPNAKPADSDGIEPAIKRLFRELINVKIEHFADAMDQMGIRSTAGYSFRQYWFCPKCQIQIKWRNFFYYAVSEHNAIRGCERITLFGNNVVHLLICYLL